MDLILQTVNSDWNTLVHTVKHSAFRAISIGTNCRHVSSKFIVHKFEAEIWMNIGSISPMEPKNKYQKMYVCVCVHRTAV